MSPFFSSPEFIESSDSTASVDSARQPVLARSRGLFDGFRRSQLTRRCKYNQSSTRCRRRSPRRVPWPVATSPSRRRSTILSSALAPAIRQAAMDLAEQAAVEVRAQLPDRTVDLVLSDGDPSLRIADAAVATEPTSTEELDARITLRVPPSLKTLIEDAAETAGASVNSWVLDALSRRARKPAQGHGFRMTHSFDL